MKDIVANLTKAIMLYCYSAEKRASALLIVPNLEKIQPQFAVDLLVSNQCPIRYHVFMPLPD